jgi:hypothetical protein
MSNMRVSIKRSRFGPSTSSITKMGFGREERSKVTKRARLSCAGRPIKADASLRNSAKNSASDKCRAAFALYSGTLSAKRSALGS